MNKRKTLNKKLTAGGKIVIAGFCCLVAACCFLVYKYMPSFERVDFSNEMRILSGRGYFITGGEILTDVSPPVLRDDALYIPVDFIKAYLDKYIFWDERADRLSITTENKVIHMRTDNLDYFVNEKPMELNLPAHKIDGEAYLPADFVQELYNVEINYRPDSMLAIVDFNEQPLTSAEILKKAQGRTRPDIKAPILFTLEEGDKVVVLERGEGFSKIRSSAGYTSYVRTDRLANFEDREPIAKTAEQPVKPAKPLSGKIAIVWDQVTTVEANSNPNRRLTHPGLDVLSPTWFSFDADKLNGDIISLADKAYVDWAHENGYQVWALITDNFSTKINHAILSDTNVREHVIKQLLALCAMYELDGINIDFEALRSSDAEYYLQFLRELGPLLREQGASLSVDMFVPTYTKYYNRAEVSKAADYICVMTYDEHYSGSATSGPVASLPFVDRGIADTMMEVPKEKIIMGLPFYVRTWREENIDGVVTHSIVNNGMETAYSNFIDKGASFTWLPDIGSYYAEYNSIEDGKEITYKVWLEDLRSIEEKLKIATAYDVAGVAGWKRGLEADGVWEAIEKWKGN